MINREEIIKQYYLDVGRLDLYINNEKCNKDADYIKNYLYKELNEEQAFIAIYSLTQTFLAEFYIKEFKNFIKNEEHLLDNKNFIVDINVKNKLIYITKEFKIVYFSDDKNYITDYCILNVSINLENFNILYTWNYEFKIDEPLMIESIKI